MLLKAVKKSKKKKLFRHKEREIATTFAITLVGRAITIERAIKKCNKELTLKIKHRILRAITLQAPV